MKKIIIFLVTIYIQNCVAAQKISVQQVITINGYSAINTSSGISSQGGFGWQAGVVASVPIYKKWQFEAGILYEYSKYAIDGYFTVENNNHIFKQIPASYTQHMLYMNAINIPVKLKLDVGNDFIIGAGLVNSIYGTSVSKYKTGQDKFETVSKDFKKFQIAPIVGFEKHFKRGKSFFAVGGDVRYQLTSFTNTKSFNPLSYNIRLQFPIFN